MLYSEKRYTAIPKDCPPGTDNPADCYGGSLGSGSASGSAAVPASVPVSVPTSAPASAPPQCGQYSPHQLFSFSTLAVRWDAVSWGDLCLLYSSSLDLCLSAVRWDTVSLLDPSSLDSNFLVLNCPSHITSLSGL